MAQLWTQVSGKKRKETGMEEKEAEEKVGDVEKPLLGLSASDFGL
jgi:hypothetical protein